MAKSNIDTPRRNEDETRGKLQMYVRPNKHSRKLN